MAGILVIMAAGLGSRFGGDKQIARLGPRGEILMEYSVYDAVRSGFDRIVFVIRPGMECELSAQVESMRRSHPGTQFVFAEQRGGAYEALIPDGRSKPLGTVHALLSAAEYIDAPFAVINADDYYGRRAFEAICRAMGGFDSSADGAMVAYSLYNTLSRHGAVTRGICDIEDGRLRSIRESYSVFAGEDGKILEKNGGEFRTLDKNSPVSMNMWAFHNGILPEIDAYFRDFLSRLPPADNKNECLLPVMTEEFIKRGLLNIEVLTTNDRWFGLTYNEDAADAAWEIDKRHQDGTYPEGLFA